MNILKDKQQLAIFCVILAVTAGFVFLRYMPLKNRLKTIEQTLASQKLLLSQASAEKAKLTAEQEKLLALRKASAVFDMRVPSERNLGGFLGEMANLMNR